MICCQSRRPYLPSASRKAHPNIEQWDSDLTELDDKTQQACCGDDVHTWTRLIHRDCTSDSGNVSKQKQTDATKNITNTTVMVIWNWMNLQAASRILRPLCVQGTTRIHQIMNDFYNRPIQTATLHQQTKNRHKCWNGRGKLQHCSVEGLTRLGTLIGKLSLVSRVYKQRCMNRWKDHLRNKRPASTQTYNANILILQDRRRGSHHLIPVTQLLKLSSVSTTSAISIAACWPPPMATPTCALFMAAMSLTPSPVTATICPELAPQTTPILKFLRCRKLSQN